jgi:hypothetical protein
MSEKCFALSRHKKVKGNQWEGFDRLLVAWSDPNGLSEVRGGFRFAPTDFGDDSGFRCVR